MSDIDFSKAPEGATHKCQNFGRGVTYYRREVTGDWSYYTERGCWAACSFPEFADRYALPIETHQTEGGCDPLNGQQQQQQQQQIERLTRLLAERQELVEEVYQYGRSNPATAPACVSALVEHFDAEVS